MDQNIEYLKDQQGRIIRWPKKKAEKLAVLRYINSKFEVGRIYSESEVNQLIDKWHNFCDYALVRREMYNQCLLERKPDGKEYWIDNKEEL